jgi:hypothetical protein
MKKYFIIIYPNREDPYSREDPYWENIRGLCDKKIGDKDSYSSPFECNEFILYFYQTTGEVEKASLQEFFKNRNINPDDDEIIIFGHEYRGADHPGVSSQTLATFKKIQYRIFSTAEGRDSYPCQILLELNSFLQNNTIFDCANFKQMLSKSNINFDWNTLKEEVKKKGIIEPFSFLKHRIVNLLLSVDAELQGISFEKSKEKKVDYLGEMLKNKNNKFYQQKLKTLQSMVKEEIIGLINKEKQEDEEVRKYWKNLLKLCGLNYDEDESFEKSKISSNENSPIFQFMVYLDDLTEKWDTLTANEKRAAVIKIINFNKLKELLKELNQPLTSIPFHNWYEALIDCLDKLREKILIDK